MSQLQHCLLKKNSMYYELIKYFEKHRIFYRHAINLRICLQNAKLA